MKDKVCGVILGLIILILAILFVLGYSKRVEDIKNGDFTIISDSECDR